MKINAIITSLCLVFTLASCHFGKKETAETTLTIGVMSSMDYLPIAVAQAAGYFEKAGIQVDLQKFYAPNERDAALQSGNLDGCILDYTGAAIQRAGGVPLFVTSQCDGTFELIAGKNSGVRAPADLRGKTTGVSRHTVIDFCTDMVLENSGLMPSDVTKSEINKIPLRLEMLRNGKIDFAVLPDPFATIARSDGNPVVVSMRDLDVHVTGLVFTQAAIEGKEKAIRAFYKAYNAAVTDLQTKPLSDFSTVLTAEIGFPEPLVGAVKLPPFRLATLPPEKDLQAVSRWLKSNGLVPADFEIHTLINADFVSEQRP